MFTGCCEVLTRSDRSPAPGNRSRCTHVRPLGVQRCDRPRPLTVAARHRVHDRPVLRPGVDRTGRRLHRVHPGDLVPELGERRGQGVASGGLGERLVEPAAQGAQILAVAPPGPLLAQPDQAAQHLEVGLGAPLGGPGGTQRLQEHAHLQQVGGLLLGGLGDTRARVPPGHHEALGLQGAQGLADGDARDAVPAREQFLGEPAAALVDTGDDVVPDRRAYRVRRNTHVRPPL